MIVAISQRIQIIESYSERRDSLDQRWLSLLNELDITAIPIPNNIDVAKKIFESIPFEGIILTGGGDLARYGGNTPERDETENFLLEFAILNNLPLLGVCRGMQLIQSYFDVPLEKVQNHIAQRHNIFLQEGQEVVNSYHAWGTTSSVEDLIVLAKSDDGVIEAIQHVSHPIIGIMWHPEREKHLTQLDKNFLSLFKRFI